jgi:hypothetical protein
MSTSSLTTNLKTKPASLGAWRTVFFSLTLALLVSACGGGSSSTNAASGATNPNLTPPTTTQPVVDPNTSTAVSPGVYTALLNGKEITSIVMQNSPTNSSSAQLYALQFNAPFDPDIYSGSLTGIGSNSATISNLTYFQNVSGSLRKGTAILTVPSAGLLKTTVSYTATTTEGAIDLTWYANPDNRLKLDTPALLEAIQGKWIGRWTYAYGFVDNFSLTISDTGAASSSMAFQSDCQINNGSVSPAMGGVNLFSVSFTVPNATQCFLKSQNLTGVAYVTSSPTPGKTQRLQWLATTADGRGVSFRAER